VPSEVGVEYVYKNKIRIDQNNNNIFPIEVNICFYLP